MYFSVEGPFSYFIFSKNSYPYKSRKIEAKSFFDRRSLVRVIRYIRNIVFYQKISSTTLTNVWLVNYVNNL